MAWHDTSHAIRTDYLLDIAPGVNEEGDDINDDEAARSDDASCARATVRPAADTLRHFG